MGRWSLLLRSAASALGQSTLLSLFPCAWYTQKGVVYDSEGQGAKDAPRAIMPQSASWTQNMNMYQTDAQIAHSRAT